jgi:TonB-dependent starch-binding outer membrane protein SusC
MKLLGRGYWRRLLPAKLLLVMRITTVFLLVGALHVSAGGFGQTVSYSGKNVSLEKVFSAIKDQTGYVFFYKLPDLADAKPVTIELKNVPLEMALDKILKDQSLSYSIQGNTVFINLKASTPVLQSGALSLQVISQDVEGKIVNDKNEPLAGASVSIKGAKKGTSTDSRGHFELKTVPAGSVLVISFTGYQTKEVKTTDSKASITVVLTLASNQLDQAQVIAYGTTTPRLSTGDVTTVTSKEIDEQPVSNPLLALEGRVPGLFISQTTGFAGTGITAHIMGQNSLANGNDPLYVIDGVPYTSDILPTFNYVQGGGGYSSPSAMSFINPNDIESISVLKDADATSIYGSRAANGAILITTKKGKFGPSKIDFNLQNGWGQDTRRLKLLNTQQYLQMRHEALTNDGLTPATTDYDINGDWDTTHYTDWQKSLLGKTAQYTNLTGSVSGGNANTQYLISGTYHRETTVFPGEFADDKGSLHFNISNTSPNQKFKLQLTGSYLVDHNKLPSTDLTADAVELAPDAPAIYGKDRSLNWAPDINGNSTWTNPLAYLYDVSTLKTTNLIGNGIISYQILPGLDIKSSFGYTNLQVNETSIYPLSAVAPENRPFSENGTGFGFSNVNSWIVEPQATYKRTILKGKLDVIIGETIEQTTSLGQQLTAVGFNSDLQLYNIGAAASIYASTSASSIYKYNAVFGRVGYNWDDKYIITLTERRDGSSRFGPADQFHNFGSIGGSWIFSKEHFFLTTLPVVSFGKLGASYGTTGSDQIGDYQFQSLFSSTSVPSPYQGVAGLQPNGLTNPYLQWESTRKWRFGLDLGVLKDRLLLTTNYFLNRSSNQLLPYSLPAITGFTSISRNFPAIVQNYGWEFTLNSINIKSKFFSWTTHITLTIPQNKLLAFQNLATSSYAFRYIIGKPITIQKAYIFRGVNDTTGEYQFADAKGVLTSNPTFGIDNIAAINTAPEFYGGMQNSFTFKGFQLDIFFQFVKQTSYNYLFGNLLPGYFSGSGNQGNQPATVLGAWQKPGDITNVQRYNSNYSLVNQFVDASNSSAAYSDGSYIRLKNLSFSWQIPEAWRNKANLQNVRIYLQGQNLFTITKYKGLDPETPSSSVLPPLRVVTFGLQLTL